MSIVAESPGWLQVFSDGTVKRFAPEIAPPSDHYPSSDFKSKDVVLDVSKQITGRIFIPHNLLDQHAKLPVLVYFHGGGFCIGSTTWLGYHVFLGQFSAASTSIVLSIDYRLAPEHKLPTAYEDCYYALKWLYEQHSQDPWLSRCNLSRVFLAGDSAGGNIVHNVALKTINQKHHHPLGYSLKGLILIHPYFGSELRTTKEAATGSEVEVSMNDMFWRLSLPEESNRDFEGCNYNKYEMAAKGWQSFPSTAVFVAELDFLKERGIMYAEFLKSKGAKNVELVETENESHVFHVFRPDSVETRLMTHQITDFMNRCL
ncbi:unnamed protein product [Rhodiola kirilowii]